MNTREAMGSNACAGIIPEDCEQLDQAAVRLLDARGLIVMISDAVGHMVGDVGGSAANFLQDKFGFDVKAKAEAVVEEILWHAQTVAITGMDVQTDGEPWDWFHKIVVGASGASAGFFGAPGLIWDLPITTGMIMRSIADIARSHPGESLDLDETKRACIEVFAFGGPETEDDNIDFSYWTTRAGLSHIAIETLIRTASSRFGAMLTEKALAQVVPIAGLVAGGGLNYVFMDYYQQMARVHFAIRGVERRALDPSAVKACFSYRLNEIRRRRKLRPDTSTRPSD